MSAIATERDNLLHMLHEEFITNGGYFASQDTDLWFKQMYCEFGESPTDAFKRLLVKKK